MSGKGGRMYGLILKKRPSASLEFIKPSIFQDDDSSSDEDEKGRKAVNETIGKEAEKKKQMRQTQIERDKVLDEDPTAYEYDEVYDEMAEKKTSLVVAESTATDKKPKYIGSLLKFAEVRKKEEERRIERQVQKEREAEGSEFVDKEAFVTSAYRKKMQEMAEDEERQRKLDELEGDVTKQTDLSKFYRNLLEKNVSTGGAYDSEARTKFGEKLSDTDQESSSSVKNADAKEKHHEESYRRREKTLEKSDRQLKQDEQPKWEDSFEVHPSRTKKEDSHDRNTKSVKLGRDEGQREKTRDGEGRREKIRDSEERRGKTRDSKGRREKARDSEGRRGKTRDNDGQRETTKDGRAKVTKDDKGRREPTKDSEEKETVSRESNEREMTKDDSRDDEEEMKEIEIKTPEKKQTLDSKAMNDETRKKEQEKSVVSKFAKHSSSESVVSARERYLARKNVRVVMTQPTSEDEDE